MTSTNLGAILIAPRGPTGPLQGLVERLTSAGVDVAVVDELETAVEIAHRHMVPPTLLLDLREASAGEIEDQQIAGDAIRRTIAALPNTLPVVVTNDADPV